MSRLGLGIIGLGVGKGALLLNQKSDSPIKVCAAADKDPALLKLAHEDYGIGFVTEDYRCTPNMRRRHWRLENMSYVPNRW